MPEDTLKFICLDPRKSKRDAITRTLSALGPIAWRKLVPLRIRGYPETLARAENALETSTKKPTGDVSTRAKLALLRAQYNGARSLFEANRDAVAVAWNGLNGTRRVFMDGARDAGARTLYFELSPFRGRITVDPCGVNFRNGLPRVAAPYLAWAEVHGSEQWSEVRETIHARQPKLPQTDVIPEQQLADPFIFVPLQVPGDSQLRLFGGAFRTVEAVIGTIAEAAKSLPDGWHVRLKEHPTSPVTFGDLVTRLKHPKLVLDNSTDTFTQVAAARAVITVNSSVGLEAMFYEKPVVALGDCFWAIPGISTHCPTPKSVRATLSSPEEISFDPKARAAFLSFLVSEYFPNLDRDAEGGVLHPDEVAKVAARLNGPDALGFWDCPAAPTK